MNYKEIKDQFLAEYAMICSQLKLTPFEFADALVYRWIDEAVSDIIRRTKIATVELTFSTDNEGNWPLPSDFGGILWLRQGGKSLQLSLDGGAGYVITKNQAGTRELRISGCGTGPFTIRYYQEAAAGVREEGVNELNLPEGWHRAVVYYLLSRPFSNLEDKYYAEISGIKNHSNINNTSQLSYNFS